MEKKGFLIIIIFFFSVLILGYLFIKPALNYLSGYLSKSDQVKANVLIVEGWLPQYALKMAYTEFKKNENDYEYIITTGLKYFEEYIVLPENGYLIFYPGIKNSSGSEVSEHIIEVDAFGSLNGAYSAHFNLFVNDSLVSDFSADKNKRKYTIKWKGSLSDIDSVMIQFTNDKVDENGDINLFVKEIIIDQKLVIPYLNNSEYNNLDSKIRVINNFSSSAELARNWLVAKGIDSSLIIAVPCERVSINRTLTSALAFRDWLKTKKIDIKGINIISMGTHARRTWMIYNKILNERYPIGIKSLPDLNYDHSGNYRLMKTIRETLGIIYYWFILIPY
jgi:Ca-dependent carbohydrate-binding module xylan-binding